MLNLSFFGGEKKEVRLRILFCLALFYWQPKHDWHYCLVYYKEPDCEEKTSKSDLLLGMDCTSLLWISKGLPLISVHSTSFQ